MGHHGSLVIQTDGDPALERLMEMVAAQRAAPTILTHSPVRDSQSNGLVERSVRSVEEITRVLRHDLEERLGARIGVEEPVFAWLIRHATMVLNVQQPGRDGLTAFERVRGHPYRGELHPFGSRVLWKLENKPEGGVMAPRWSPGIWLGKNQASDEHLIWSLTGDRLRCARTIRILNESVTRDHLRSIDCRPIEISSGFKVRHVPPVPVPEQILESEHPTPRHDRDPGVFDPVGNANAQTRPWQITREVFDQYGATPGCPKCRDWTKSEINPGA